MDNLQYFIFLSYHATAIEKTLVFQILKLIRCGVTSLDQTVENWKKLYNSAAQKHESKFAAMNE